MLQFGRIRALVLCRLKLASKTSIRAAEARDLEAIRLIYNQGIEDRRATLETTPYDVEDIATWWARHEEPHVVVVAEDQNGETVAWASLNRFSHRCAHNAIADLSVYVARSRSGVGIGNPLLRDLLNQAREGFRKIALHALDDNVAGKRLYDSFGFRKVGVFLQHDELDGRLVDVLVMEMILS
jgi:L-amino acid N-acyltransferase YncA